MPDPSQSPAATVRSTLQSAAQQLKDSSEIETDADCNLEAEILLCHVLEKDRSWLYAWPEHELAAEQQAGFEKLLERRLKGEPVSYITGHREFWGINLVVTSDTLIPRPETELLVETALSCVTQPDANVLELGTGTGAITAALAYENPGWQFLVTDKDPKTLKIAEKNLQKYEKRSHTQISDWFEDLIPEPFDLVISNPPYIEEQDSHLQQGDLRFEPRHALASGPDGLDDIRIITQSCKAYLKSGGFLILEHGYNQGTAVPELFQTAGLRNIQTIRDLSGHDRLTIGQLP